MPKFAKKPEAELSQHPSAVKARKKRARREAIKTAAEVMPRAEGTQLHTTEILHKTGAPEHFTMPITPELIDNEPPIEPGPASDPASEPTMPGGEAPAQPADPSAPPPASAPPPPTTSPAEAKLFAQAVVGYFKLGTGLLLAKNPDALQFLEALAQSDANVGKALSPQGMAVLHAFIGGCAERVALKYNLRIPYMDEIVVVGAIGIATFGFVPKKKKTGAVANAKDANVPNAPAPNAGTPDRSAGAGANGATPNTPPGFSPIIDPGGDAVDLDGAIGDIS